MPKSSLSDKELSQLISAIVTEGGKLKVAELLDHCHEHKTFGAPGLNEKYFHKELAYRDFDLHISLFRCNDDAVMAADVQFKRPSRFPSPWLSRNRELVKTLLKILDPIYSTKSRTFGSTVYAIARDEVKDEHSRQIHFDADVRCLPSAPFEEWNSECAIYDEPRSSGQTDPDETKIRNDFVIVRFRRKVAT